MRVVFRDDVELELIEVALWYDERVEGLGTSFRSAVKAAIEQIRSSPFSFQEVHEDIRRVGVRPFPYGVYYLVHNDTIHVLGVVHDARHPRTWRDRR